MKLLEDRIKKDGIVLPGNILKVSDNKENDSGIKSKIDATSITPAAKLSDASITKLFLRLKIKISIVPIIVDSPASVVNKKGI